MHIKGILLIFCVLVLVRGCDSNPDLGSGFEVIDGGGSKFSLSRDGNILINYVVTGTGRIDEHIIIESKEYNSSTCVYYYVDSQRRLIRIGPPHVTEITLSRAVEAVEAINQRSCKAS